jgi:hypothetical protein
MKYIIEITTIDELPENHFSRDSWSEEGIYQVKGDEYLYHVSRYSVDFIPNNKLFVKTEYHEPKSSVPEELFLKAIAASHGKSL